MDQFHIIKRQIIDVNLDSDIGSFSLKSELGEIYHSELVPIIDRFCSEMSDPREIHRIEKLEIDLGEIDPDNLKYDFVNKASDQFSRELVKALENGDFENAMIQKRASLPNEREIQERNKVTEHLTDFELLEYFLETGRLPWWNRRDTQVNITKIIDSQLRKTDSRLDRLLKEVINHPVLVKRLVYQLPDKILNSLVGLFQSQNQQVICDVRASFTNVISTSDILKSVPFYHIRNEVWIGVLSHLTVAREYFSNTWLSTKTLTSHISKAFQINEVSLLHFLISNNQLDGINELLATLSDLIQNETSLNLIPEDTILLFRKVENDWKKITQLSRDSPDLAKNLELLKTKLRKLAVSTTSNKESVFVEKITQLVRVFNSEAEFDTRKSDAISQIDKLLERDFFNPIKKFSDSEELYISNAGVILFWPYLNRFFDSLGLLEKGLFENRDKQHKAIWLLQYLVQGNGQLEEYDLILNKILCGCDPNDPIPMIVSLSASEIRQADNLIATLIGHWAALKNMSSEGLRKLFLLREGIITIREGNWLVRVEEKSHDVLIDKLPWQISTIKLPWIENLIFVEWRL